jgi:DHA1 family inner membrane transport protein
VPLLYVTEPPIARAAAAGAYAAAKAGVRLFFADGFICMSSGVAWNIIMFRALGARYDAFGVALAVAGLAGALGGMLLGRFIDRGHALQLTLVNAAVLVGSLIVKAMCEEAPIPIIAVAVVTTMLGGLYIPALMTALYNEAKVSPCPLRFHFADEGGWDAGGTAACLAVAAICGAQGPLQLAVLLALPMVAVQARLLLASYSRHARGRLQRGTVAPVIAGDV